MLRDLPRPIVIAHRGASAHAPENTMAAFDLAAREGAAAIELDAQLTADDQLVVFHDVTLKRCTDGQGRVSEKSLAELRPLDAGSRFSPEFRGERIPLLEEVLASLGRRLLVNIHIKGYPGSRPGLVGRICDLIRRLNLGDGVFFSSFNPADLRRASKLLPATPRCLLAARGWPGAWARSFGFTFGDYTALHPHWRDVGPRQVVRVHRLRRRVHAWTVNDPAEIARLADWGVDGILTDDPGAALQALGRRR
jgi:glycerophosphoryl diester phosphodiesterase